MKILVTGYSGFLGKFICDKFSKDHEIIKLNCRNINFKNKIEIENLLKNFLNIDVVINCAASLKPQNSNDLFINEKFPKLIKEVRGKGFLIGLQLFKDQTNFISDLMKNKLLTIRAAENVIRILPPLNVKKKEINQALKIISKVCLLHK